MIGSKINGFFGGLLKLSKDIFKLVFATKASAYITLIIKGDVYPRPDAVPIHFGPLKAIEYWLHPVSKLQGILSPLFILK